MEEKLRGTPFPFKGKEEGVCTKIEKLGPVEAVLKTKNNKNFLSFKGALGGKRNSSQREGKKRKVVSNS